ncbi:MAG: hypothetical protein JWQ20_1405 [Conexibacter sp.]|nr:hypothetical protein [Conexibacter sp.]
MDPGQPGTQLTRIATLARAPANAPPAERSSKAGHMYVKELKAQVQDDLYVVDPHLVAEALLRKAASRRADAPSVSRRGARDHAAAAPRPQQ